jgi:hypothetical protein
VLESDLAEPAVARWPAFAQAGVGAGILAVFAFPLALGAIRLGVLVLYRDRSGVLSGDDKEQSESTPPVRPTCGGLGPRDGA